jgi:hypothetical protein
MAYTPVHTYIPGTGMTGTSPVTAWADQTGSANWANSGSNANSYSSPLLTLPGSSLLTTTITALTTPFYIALRVKVASTSSGQIFLTAGSMQCHITAGTLQPSWTANGSNFGSSSDNIPGLNTLFNIIYLFNGASSNVWIDGVANSGGLQNAGTGSSGTTLRFNADSSGYSDPTWQPSVGRISIGTASSFDSTDVSALNTWLSLGAGSSGGAYSRATMNGGMRDLTGGMR